jgi:hypothetical protein
MNNNAIPGNWKRAIVVPIYKVGDRSVVGNYRPVSLTLVVCKQMEHVIAGYLRQVWEINGWFKARVLMLKPSSYGLSEHRGFTGRGIQDRSDNNILFKGFRFSST